MCERSVRESICEFSSLTSSFSGQCKRKFFKAIRFALFPSATPQALAGARQSIRIGIALGYGEAYSAINYRRAKHIGRRTKVDLALAGEVRAALTQLLPKVTARSDSDFLEKHRAEARDFYDLLNHYVDKGPVFAAFCGELEC